MRLIINRISLWSAFKLGCFITLISTVCLTGPFILGGVFIFSTIAAFIRPIVSPADFALLSNTTLGRGLILVVTVFLAGLSGGISWALSAFVFNVAARFAGGFTLFIQRPPRRLPPPPQPESKFDLADERLENEFERRSKNLDRAEDFEAVVARPKR